MDRMIVGLFSNHFTHYPSSVNVNILFIIGFLLISCLAIQSISGVCLSFYYINSSDFSFCSSIYILINFSFGYLFHFLHVHGASYFLLFLYFHILRSFIYNCFYRSFSLWIIGSILGLFIIAISFLGYSLPFGQMSYWGFTVIISILASVMILIDSNVTVEFLFSNYSLFLGRCFIFHILLSFIAIVLSFIHIIILHTISSTYAIFSFITYKVSSTLSYNIGFFPFIVLKDYWFAAGWVAVLFFIILWFPSFTSFGNADNFILANPIITPTHILPEWYFLIFYSILRSFPTKLLGVIAVFLFLFNFILIGFGYGFRSYNFLNFLRISTVYFFRPYSIVSILFFIILIFIFGSFYVEEYYLSIQRFIISIFLILY